MAIRIKRGIISYRHPTPPIPPDNRHPVKPPSPLASVPHATTPKITPTITTIMMNVFMFYLLR